MLAKNDPRVENYIRQLQTTPKDVGLWLSLASLMRGRKNKKYCYQSVLLLEPDNQAAKQGLEALAHQQTRTLHILLSILAVISAVGFVVIGIAAYKFTPIGWHDARMDPDGMGVSEFYGATVEYYDIEGKTWDELVAQIRLVGPESVQLPDEDSVAQTQWDYVLQYSFDETQCTWSAYEGESYIKVVFPRWVNPQDAPDTLVEEWKEYIAGVARHEQHHINILWTGMAKIQLAVWIPDCKIAAQAELALYNEMIRQTHEYEIETNYGEFE